MTDKHVQSEAPHSNMEKDPSTWVTGDEPMTGAQMSYLKTLSEEAKVDFDETLTKAEASKRIDELQHKTGRGTGTSTEHAAPSAGTAKQRTAARPDAADNDASEAGEEDPGAAEDELVDLDAARSTNSGKH